MPAPLSTSPVKRFECFCALVKPVLFDLFAASESFEVHRLFAVGSVEEELYAGRLATVNPAFFWQICHC